MAPMLGHRLDDRKVVARRQASDLASHYALASEIPLPAGVDLKDFFVAPLDILPFRRAGQRRFQLLELNGTGIGGLTNMPVDLVEEILDTIGEIGNACKGPAPLVVVASSGREAMGDRKPSHLLHEKLLFVDRIARALEERLGDVEILALDSLVANGGWRGPSRPTVLLGYTRELVSHTHVICGMPRLFGRSVAGIVNDRFLFNLTAAYGALDIDSFLPANRCYESGADKATAYRHVNSFAARNTFDEVGAEIHFDVCKDAESLIETVRARLGHGEQIVIKPSGTGHGDGIEFFFGGEDEEVIRERLGRSLAVVHERYGQGAGFPYAATEYLDAEVIRTPGHALKGCKFELRIVVYRRGSMLRAVPSIAKVAPEVWDAHNPTRGSLINNISASVRGEKTGGADHLLPLCLPETLSILDLDEDILTKLCRWGTGYVAHVLWETRRQSSTAGL
ncbi:hypothetical protein RZS28_19060 (plasmid) [Methylocapsa polymorpha]|uniref:ATP-grasp domain-containing protein n=1 Tax=Methylocapsa polymorpha TaxID=3080828 RepID=A0ABZ0HX29_9HYPH|nr:hypothetical protein RZS28_19060 [Methylocapsa sp. RX1]